MADPSIHLGGVALPGDLEWTDEHAWSMVVRASEYSLTGALILQEAAKQAGRPITLSSDNDRAWITVATLASLQALNALPGWTGTLVLADARTFTVAFRDEGIVAAPAVFQAPSGAYADWWQVTLQLIEV